jgi:tRNA1(Val) A37 N6-methylase TrmN6
VGCRRRPAAANRPLAIADIGSGLGGLVLDLARRRPDAQVDGIELAPLPWLVSRLRAKLSGSRARFLRGDYEAVEFRSLRRRVRLPVAGRDGGAVAQGGE